LAFSVYEGYDDKLQIFNITQHPGAAFVEERGVDILPDEFLLVVILALALIDAREQEHVVVGHIADGVGDVGGFSGRRKRGGGVNEALAKNAHVWLRRGGRSVALRGRLQVGAERIEEVGVVGQRLIDGLAVGL